MSNKYTRTKRKPATAQNSGQRVAAYKTNSQDQTQFKTAAYVGNPNKPKPGTPAYHYR